MKVLAILGSPKKFGNTYRIVEKIREHLISMDRNMEFETLFISDSNLQMCKGCFACFSKGSELCPLKDDRAQIEAAMLQADGIIFAAPTYAMGVPALMKNFIDRFAYTLHRPCFFDQAFLAVSTVGGVVGVKEALNQLALLSSGGKSVYKLGVTCSPVSMPFIEKRIEKNIIKAAMAFHRSLDNKKRKLPSLMDWLYFGSLKAMAGLDSYHSKCPADYAYYKDKDDYFYNIEGHLARRLVGKIMRGLMRWSMKLMVK